MERFRVLARGKRSISKGLLRHKVESRFFC